MERVLHRADFYRFSMTAALQCLGIDPTGISFVLESSYETPKFIQDLWRLCTLVPAQTVRDSWDRAVHPEMVSPLMCPLLQLLSEEYMNADFQFGGVDQVCPPALSLSVGSRRTVNQSISRAPFSR
jgi:tyrosyl-tRNA synthetase